MVLIVEHHSFLQKLQFLCVIFVVEIILLLTYCHTFLILKEGKLEGEEKKEHLMFFPQNNFSILLANADLSNIKIYTLHKCWRICVIPTSQPGLLLSFRYIDRPVYRKKRRSPGFGKVSYINRYLCSEKT